MATDQKPQLQLPFLKKTLGYALPTKQVYTPNKQTPLWCWDWWWPLCWVCCCAGCCVCIIITFIIMLLTCGFLYILLNPQPPVFQLQSFNLTTFNVTQNPDGPSYLNAVSSLHIGVLNPNSRLTLRYGDSDVTVSVGERNEETPLGRANLPGFDQGTKNVTSLRVETRAEDQVVEEGVGQSIMDGFMAGSLVVNVVVKSSLGVGMRGFVSRMLAIDVECSGVPLMRLGDGDMPRCTIKYSSPVNNFN